MNTPKVTLSKVSLIMVALLAGLSTASLAAVSDYKLDFGKTSGPPDNHPFASFTDPAIPDASSLSGAGADLSGGTWTSSTPIYHLFNANTYGDVAGQQNVTFTDFTWGLRRLATDSAFVGFDNTGGTGIVVRPESGNNNDVSYIAFDGLNGATVRLKSILGVADSSFSGSSRMRVRIYDSVANAAAFLITDTVGVNGLLWDSADREGASWTLLNAFTVDFANSTFNGDAGGITGSSTFGTTRVFAIRRGSNENGSLNNTRWDDLLFSVNVPDPIVPEPTSVALLGLGALLVCVRRCRKP